MSPQRLWQEADDVQDLYSAIGADAARAETACATDKAGLAKCTPATGAGTAHTVGAAASITADIARCTLPLRELLERAPRALQETRGVLCHRVRCWRHENGGHLEMFSATGAGAGQSAGDGATDTTVLRGVRWRCMHGWTWRHRYGRNHEVYSATGAGAACSAEAGATDTVSTVAMNSATGAVVAHMDGAGATGSASTGAMYSTTDAEAAIRSTRNVLHHWRGAAPKSCAVYATVGVGAAVTAGAGAKLSTPAARAAHTATLAR